MFIANAYAAAPGTGTELLSLTPMLIIFVLFYFMLIRPQMKQTKAHKAMIAALTVGAEVVTTGGVLGKVTKVSDDFFALEIATNTIVNIQKDAVQTLLPPGTLKTV